MTLRRGFKSESERIAAEQRQRLDLEADAPINPFALLSSHGITIRTPQDVHAMAVMPADTVEILTVGADYWSAITVRTPAGTVVVHNPQHERPRQHSNLTHELAHVLLGHTPGALQTVGGCVMRDFDEIQEEEAACLGDTLLAPRAALATAARRRLNLMQTAEWLGASTQLTRYRANTTGITRQYRGFASS